MIEVLPIITWRPIPYHYTVIALAVIVQAGSEKGAGIAGRTSNSISALDLIRLTVTNFWEDLGIFMVRWQKTRCPTKRCRLPT